MSNEERARLRAGNFIHNNGLVLRIINILRYKYNRLTGVKDVVASHGVSEDEYLTPSTFWRRRATSTSDSRRTKRPRRWRITTTGISRPSSPARASAC